LKKQGIDVIAPGLSGGLQLRIKPEGFVLPEKTEKITAFTHDNLD
jgi:hypothetical protein